MYWCKASVADILAIIQLLNKSHFEERILKEIAVVSFLLSDLNSSNEWVLKTAPSAAAKRRME